MLFQSLVLLFVDLSSSTSVLVRVLHPCVVLALWKLFRGCGCCVLMVNANPGF